MFAGSVDGIGFGAHDIERGVAHILQLPSNVGGDETTLLDAQRVQCCAATSRSPSLIDAIVFAQGLTSMGRVYV